MRPKKLLLYSCAWLRQMLTNFQSSLTLTLGSKFIMPWFSRNYITCEREHDCTVHWPWTHGCDTQSSISSSQKRPVNPDGQRQRPACWSATQTPPLWQGCWRWWQRHGLAAHTDPTPHALTLVAMYAGVVLRVHNRQIHTHVVDD